MKGSVRVCVSAEAAVLYKVVSVVLPKRSYVSCKLKEETNEGYDSFFF